MQNLDVLTRQLFFTDDSFERDGNRIGVVRVTEQPNSSGKWIGEICPYGGHEGQRSNFPDHAEAVAMGRLFAAAPDLLQACLSIRRNESLSPEAEKILNDAIKKATE